MTLDEIIPPLLPMPPLPRPRQGRTELVVLLHGLSRTRMSLLRLEIKLRAAGYMTYNWPYRSRTQTIQELRLAFAELLTDIAPLGFARVHFVGHSLGGVLIRAGLSPEGAELLPPGFLDRFPAGRIVQIAPPNNGASIVDRLARGPWIKLAGKPVAELRKGADWLGRIGMPRAEMGIIAGTRRLHPLNPSSWINALHKLDEPHDGTVELSSARLPQAKDFMGIPASHTFIADDPETIRATLAFLKTGRFRP